MEFKALLLLLILVLVITGEIEGKGGGSRSGGSRSGGSRSRGSSGRSSGGGSRSGGGWFSGLFGGSKSSSSSSHTSSSHSSPSHSSPSHSSPSHSSSSHGSSSGYGSASGSHTAAGKPSSQGNKDATATFLHAEGGGAKRPGTPEHGSPPKPGFPPSAPPAEHISKSSSSLQSEGAKNPVWANPHIGSVHHVVPPVTRTSSGSSTGTTHVGFNRTLTHGVGANPTSHINPPYPISHGNPPYPVSHGNPPYPVSHGNPPYPVSHGNPPYPVSHGNPPYPTSHGNPPYPIPHGNPPYPTHGSTPLGGPSNHHPMGGQSYPHTNYPQSAPSSFPGGYQPGMHAPLGNPYATHTPVGSHSAPGQSFYPQQPQVLAQPASQPFIPGQTVIMMPGQQDSGRGIGQVFKEALVFSAVNAGVNRLINGAPHHHYVSETRADAGGPTHVTYNNYYNSPGGGATQGGLPAGSPVSQPSGAYVPPGPGAGSSVSAAGAGNANVPAGGASGGFGNVVGGSGAGMQGGGALGSGGQGTGGTGGSMAGVMGAAAGAANAAASQKNNQGNQNDNTPVYAPPQYRISDDELYNITEELFTKQTLNVSKYITLNLQNRSSSANVTDQAKEPLLFVQPELLDYPSISVTRALFDNYEHASDKKENRTMEKRKEENLLIDTFLNTNVMATAMKWLADKGFIDPDDFERKDILRHIWFNHFSGTTCGFERVFASEKYGDTAILGVQDWLYFDYQESLKRIDYMGYADKINLGNSSSLLKLNFQMEGIVRPNTTIFVGTLPELEMSLYTICFYARPNNLCPVSLGGTKFNLFTHSFRYFGNDLIDLGIIVI